MKKYQYNDNELLYLMFEGNDEALEIIYKKYVNLIYKRIETFRIASKNRDDFFQEGMMALNTAINSFNPFLNKSFNKYFDLILQRRFMNVLSTNKNYYYNVTLVDDINSVVSEDLIVYTNNHFSLNLTPTEQKLYRLKFIENYKSKEIAKILEWDIKKVYNGIYLLKEKIKKQL